jgi:hypothetical protein
MIKLKSENIIFKNSDDKGWRTCVHGLKYIWSLYKFSAD